MHNKITSMFDYIVEIALNMTWIAGMKVGYSGLHASRLPFYIRWLSKITTDYRVGLINQF